MAPPVPAFCVSNHQPLATNHPLPPGVSRHELSCPEASRPAAGRSPPVHSFGRVVGRVAVAGLDHAGAIKANPRSPAIRFSWAWPRATRRPTASCSGRGCAQADRRRRHAGRGDRSEVGSGRRRRDEKHRAEGKDAGHAAAWPLGARRSAGASSPTARTAIASAPATRRARSAARALRRRGRCPSSCDSRSPRASIGSRACSRPTSTWPRKTST